MTARTTRWQEILAEPQTGARRALVGANPAGDPVGFVSTGLCRDDGRAEAGEIYALYLLRSAQGQGLGRALFQAGAEYLRAAGLSTIVVWVLVGNPAEAFYAHLGGQPAGQKTITIGGDAYDERCYCWT